MANTASKPGGFGVAVGSASGTSVGISTVTVSAFPFPSSAAFEVYHALGYYLLFIQFNSFYPLKMANISGKQCGVMRNRNTSDERIPELNNFSSPL